MKKEPQQPENKSDYIHNVIRNKKLTYLKRRNMKMAAELAGYIKTATMDAHQRELCDNLLHSLRSCGGMTLYSYDGAKIELVSFLGCGHRLCNICNWDRQKKIRRKYMLLFDANPSLFSITGKDGKEKVVTAYQLNKWLSKGYTENGQVRYNIMHLMLSVPHTKDGWRGQRFYFRELTKQFNFMRKKADWLYWVYGGQFGLETTKNANGYHIHIHALLFVRNAQKNRNQLHKVVLYWWNRLTVDENNQRGAFNADEVAAILKGNKGLDENFVKELDPRGATIIHLQNIFSLKKADNGEVYKHHIDISDWHTEDFIGAVLETISYLFKPKIFAITDQYFDLEAIVDILPQVYNNRSLYSKFGCLLGEKTLNVHDNTLLEDLNEAAELKGEEGDFYSKQYFITNPANTYSTESMIRLKRHNTGTVPVPASCTSEAVRMLYESSYQKPTL